MSPLLSFNILVWGKWILGLEGKGGGKEGEFGSGSKVPISPFPSHASTWTERGERKREQYGFAVILPSAGAEQKKGKKEGSKSNRKKKEGKQSIPTIFLIILDV